MLRHWEYYFNFSAPPTTTDDVSNAGGSNDEMHIAVIDEDGWITGTAGTILETFEGVSQDSDAKDASGNSNYYPDVIYRDSKFVYVMDHILNFVNGLTKVGTTFDNTHVGNAFEIDNTSLTGGTDDFVATNAEIATAYEKFLDAENVDIDLLICGSFKQVLTQLETQKQLLLWISQRQKRLCRFHITCESRCGWSCKRNHTNSKRSIIC